VIAGALFSPVLATLLFTALTSIGSLCATLLATPLAPYLAHFFPRTLEVTRAAIRGPEGDTDVIDKSASGTWIRLSVLRLIGVVPWSGINVACGVCGVPIPDVLLGSFIGTMPWTAVTCQVSTTRDCSRALINQKILKLDRRYPPNDRLLPNEPNPTADRVFPAHLPRSPRQTRLPLLPLSRASPSTGSLARLAHTISTSTSTSSSRRRRRTSGTLGVVQGVAQYDRHRLPHTHAHARTGGAGDSSEGEARNLRSGGWTELPLTIWATWIQTNAELFIIFFFFFFLAP
jgi:hypothetical protein